jgi:MFS family permease
LHTVSQASHSTTKHDPFEALRQRNFTIYAVGNLLYGASLMMTQAAIAWQVYDISGSKLQLGMIGLVQFIPAFFGLSLIGGAFADSHDRRRIAITGQAIGMGATIWLMAFTDRGGIDLWLIYAAVIVIAVASAFENPARQALLPSVVTPKAFPNGITVSTTMRQFGFVTGPALGGLLIAVSGVGLAYGAVAILIGGSIVCLFFLHPREREGARRTVSVAAIKEGVQFVWHRQVLLGVMTLDMFAVIFGGAAALLPVFARDVLDVGAWGYGLLLASADVGAMFMAIALMFLPQIQRPGRALLFAVLGFGVGTVVFGLSRSYPLSLAAYAFVGASDQVSVVMRFTTVQLATPDELRGRVTSVNNLFIGASNQLGRVESGFVAAATTATFAVASGGIACLGVLGAVASLMPDLRRYKIGDPHARDVQQNLEARVSIPEAEEPVASKQ